MTYIRSPFRHLDSLAGSFRIPFVLSLILTPIFLLIAFLSAGAGHGGYLFTKILLPFTMLSTVAADQITLPFVLLAILQFPLYGVLLGLANRVKRFRNAILLISVVHSIAVVLCFVFIGENFS